MALTFAHLTTPLTPAEVKTSIYQVLAAVGTNTTGWKPGAVVRTIIAAVAILVASLSELMALIAKSGFLELAEGDWLTLVAKYVFGVARVEATFASGQVTLNNTGGGAYDISDPGDLVLANSARQKTYRNLAPFPLGPGETKTIEVIAIEAGSSSNSTPGQINTLVTPLIGVAVTNELALLALDTESDPSLRVRCLEKLSYLSPNGPRDAYAFAARGARRANGDLIGVTRVRVSKWSDEGQVTVTVGGATGPIAGNVDDPLTDLGAVNKIIQDDVVPDGVTATIQSATALPVSVTYEVWAYETTSLTADDLEELVGEKLAAFVGTQPIGGNVIAPASGKVFKGAIEAAIGATLPDIFHVVVTSPASDIDVMEMQVPVLGTVTCTAVHLMTIAA